MGTISFSECIEAIYNLILARNSDPAGKMSYLVSFYEKRKGLEEIIVGIINSQERALLLSHNITYKPKLPTVTQAALIEFMQQNGCSEKTIKYITFEYNIAKDIYTKNICMEMGDGIEKRIHELMKIFFPKQELFSLTQKITQGTATHKLYQPIYKVEDYSIEDTERVCQDRYEQILRRLHGLPLSQMSLLDVGCNLGYFSFSLSEHFSSVTGIEIDKNLYEACICIKNINNKQNTTFHHDDFFGNLSRYLGIYDVCLMLSTIHYIVKSKGLQTATNILNMMVNNFDYIIIEMSTSKDYDFMPDDPNKILSQLTNCEYEKICSTDRNSRPLYFIKRKRIETIFHGIKKYMKIQNIIYKPASKTYICENCVVKTFILDNRGKKLVTNELNAYLSLKSDFIPEFISAEVTGHHGRITLQRINAPLLSELYLKTTISIGVKQIIICSLISKVIEMARQGIIWNDTSAHNVFITKKGVILIDFATSSTIEKNNTIAMLTWILHDLQLNRPTSYQTNIYSLISEQTVAQGRKLVFEPEDGFFEKELQWIYDFLISFNDLSELKNCKNDTLRQIFDLGRQPIEF